MVACNSPTRRLWIDTDPSLGMFGRDADDALALAQVFGTPGVDIQGISASYGNAPLEKTLSIAWEIVSQWRGGALRPSAGAQGPGRVSRQGVEACIAALEAGSMTYLALAPLTHLAAVLQARPDLAVNLCDVIFVGGRTPGHRFFFGYCWYEFHDANMDKDPEAVRYVMATEVPLTLVPIERAEDALLPQALFTRAMSDSDEGRWLEARTRSWFWLWRWCTGLKGAPIFDSLAALTALEPDWVEVEDRRGVVEDFRARPALHAIREPGGRRVRFVSSIRAGAVAHMVRRIAHSA